MSVTGAHTHVCIVPAVRSGGVQSRIFSPLRHTNTFSAHTRTHTLFDKHPETDKIITTFKLTFSCTQMLFSQIN